MNGILNGKVAIITGASSGIGKGIARVFAREGAKVVFTYRKNKAGAENTEQEIKQLAGNAMAIKADISKAQDVDFVIKEVLEHFNRIDILVNNAGITNKYNFIDITEEQFDELFRINCKGTFFMTQKVSRLMKANSGGNIINISSLSTKSSS